jgi:hypothetical protein
MELPAPLHDIMKHGASVSIRYELAYLYSQTFLPPKLQIPFDLICEFGQLSSPKNQNPFLICEVSP